MSYPEYPSSLNALEEEVLARWRDEKLFAAVQEATADGEIDPVTRAKRTHAGFRRWASDAWVAVLPDGSPGPSGHYGD